MAIRTSERPGSETGRRTTREATIDTVADAPADEPTRPGLFARLWRKRLVVASTFGVVLFLVIGLLSLLPVGYVATGTLIVAEREPAAAAQAPAGDQAVESTVLLVRSPRLLRTLLAQPAAAAALEADCRAAARQWVNRARGLDCASLGDPEARLRWVQDHVAVHPVGNSHVVAVDYRSPSANAAQALANDVLQTFLADQRGRLMQPRDEAAEWTRQRQAQLELDLQADAGALEAFRTAQGRAAGAAAADRVSQASQRLGDAKAAEAEADLRLQEARGAPAARPELEPRPIAELKQQLAQAVALAAGAAQRLGAQNPQLAAFRRQEADLAARLAAETGRAEALARRVLEAARARVDDAARELAARTEVAARATEAEARLATMVREVDAKRAAAIALAQSLERIEAERRTFEPPVRLLDAAELPRRPAFPQRAPLLLGGLALAGLVSTSAGLLTYKPARAGPLALARTYTRIPILAMIPELRLQRGLEFRGGFPLAAAVSLLDLHPPLLEAMRILHARLSLAGFGSKLRTLLVASELDGEGKSFVTLALARLARASGRRVLVIEACLREPALEAALHGPAGAGLAGFLRGGPVQTIELGAVPGVAFLLAGDTLDDSTELLSGPRFRELLAWAEDYDLVLIDSAPVARLMDAALLAPSVDGVLFCLRAGRPPAEQPLNSLPELQRTNGNVVGLALTFVPDADTATPGIAPGIAADRPAPRQLEARPA